MEYQLNEALYKSILDSSSDLVFLKDQDFKYLMINKAGALFFGKTSEEIVNLTDYDLMLKQNADLCHMSDQEAILKNELIIQVEKIGSEHWETHKFPVLLPEGHIGVGGIIRNITEIIKANGEIQKLNSDLEERVKQRTLELERMNQELESFAYSVSHDLRAPLRAIDGFSGLLQERTKGKIDTESTRFIKVVRENTKRMEQLIKDLLFFSRASRTELKYTELNMMEIVKQICEDEINPEICKKVDLEIHTLPSAQGDLSLLRQVWINLIDNAFKYTKQQKNPRIEIGSYPVEDQQIFYIRDNGVGFDPAYSKKIFGVFQRLHSSDQFEGTGVGLAIVERIIQRHGGAIWAESKENEGAKFFFSLPVRKTN
jgi:PAS domain S-box-containing protein